MKFFSVFVLILGLARLGAQEINNGDFSKKLEGWKVDLPKAAQPLVETVPDAADGKPALRITLQQDVDEKTAWKGNLQQTISIPAAGSYTITFIGRSEPVKAPIVVNVADKVSGDNLAPVAQMELTDEWQEFLCNLSVDRPSEVNLTLRNLAQGGRTLYFSNFRIAKE